MNVEHLRLFIRIAHLGNISMAGKELGLSPAVASNSINKLEQHLGIKLIYRTTRKVSLTSEGKSFLPHAENVINSVEQAKSSIGSGNITPEGKLRIAAPASFARMHLVPALDEFLVNYPKLDIELMLSDSIIDMVEGGFDIAIRDAELSDSSLIAKKLANDKRIICAAPTYIKKHGLPVSPADINDHFSVNLKGLETWHFIDGSKETKATSKPRLTTDNGEVVRDACVQGLGLALLSTWCAYEKLISGELIQVMDNFPLISNTKIWAVYPSSRLVPVKVRAFIDYFHNHFQNPYWDVELDNH